MSEADKPAASTSLPSLPDPQALFAQAIAKPQAVLQDIQAKPQQLLQQVQENIHAPQAALKQKLQDDWGWLGNVSAAAGTNQLRAAVKTTREAATAVVETCQAAVASVERTVAWASRPSETVQRGWASMLDFRRKYPAAIVGVCTLFSVLPGLRARSPRILLRNSLLGGGTACVLMYPEFVMRTAPYVAKAGRKIEETAKKVEERVKR